MVMVALISERQARARYSGCEQQKSVLYHSLILMVAFGKVWPNLQFAIFDEHADIA